MDLIVREDHTQNVANSSAWDRLIGSPWGLPEAQGTGKALVGHLL